MTYLVNGHADTHIDVQDRGLLYGDGLFETIAVHDGQAQLWDRHMQRLQQGCARLAMACPDLGLLREEALTLYKDINRAVLKIIITRGRGGRGYRHDNTCQPSRILGIHPWPDYPVANKQEGITVRICTTRLGSNPALAGIKHLNRLEQVLARQEWSDPLVSEGLMLDSNGYVIEGTISNLFIVQGDTLLTPDLSDCGVAGIMRGLILERCADMPIQTRITPLKLDDVMACDELFVCNSLIGIWPVRSVAGRDFSVGPLTRRIMAHIEAWIKAC